jgi:hypothetical protein
VQIDPNGRVVGGITTLLEFIALNLMYLISCLPVVTIMSI